jgi:MFS family permease
MLMNRRRKSPPRTARRPAWFGRVDAGRLRLVVLLVGLLVAEATLLVLGPSILAAQTRDAICDCPSASVAVRDHYAGYAQLFSTAATIGQLLGILFLSPLGDRVERRRLLTVTGLAASALICLLPFLGVLPLLGPIAPKLAIMFAAGFMLPVEPIGRALLEHHLRLDASRLQAEIKLTFAVGLAALRFALVKLAVVTGSPWWAMLWAAVLLAVLLAVGARLLPKDTTQHELKPTFTATLRALRAAVRNAESLWAAAFGGATAAGQGFLDGLTSDVLADHGLTWLNAWFGLPALLGSIFAMLYVRTQPRSRSFSLWLSIATMLAAYLVMIPTLGLHGDTFGAVLMGAAIVAYLATNIGFVATIGTAAKTNSGAALWVAFRIVVLTIAGQLAAITYGRSLLPGAIIGGLVISAIPAILIPIAKRSGWA